jgi:hypothetical protein
MLVGCRTGWCWEKCGEAIKLSGEGLVATKGTYGSDLVTSGKPLSEGRHFWEVVIADDPTGHCDFNIGAVRPGLDHEKSHWQSNDAYYIHTNSGSLYGNGKFNADEQGKFAVGDRVGVLLDLDAGWLRFYHNGKRCGPGFTEGVTGPLVRAAEIYDNVGTVLTVLPGAAAPEGAGDDDEPWLGQDAAEREA